jgi:ActR/RegA family two-component response regulator
MTPAHLSALRQLDRAKWKKIVTQAMKGRMTAEAAAYLGVGRRTLARWLAELPDVPRPEAHRPRLA